MFYSNNVHGRFCKFSKICSDICISSNFPITLQQNKGVIFLWYVSSSAFLWIFQLRLSISVGVCIHFIEHSTELNNEFSCMALGLGL